MTLFIPVPVSISMVCPFCGGEMGVSDEAVVHTTPSCEKYRDLDGGDFVVEVLAKQRETTEAIMAFSKQRAGFATKIYVASSWRNTYQPEVVAKLREDGHEVYDFKAPVPGNDGFRWSDIDPNWKDWDPGRYAQALDHPIAAHGHGLDMAALEAADLCVLVLPSGRSASFEYGYHWGRTGRPGIVYMPEPCEPELMYRGSKFASTLFGLRDMVKQWIRETPSRSRE